MFSYNTTTEPPTVDVLIKSTMDTATIIIIIQQHHWPTNDIIIKHHQLVDYWVCTTIKIAAEKTCVNYPLLTSILTVSIFYRSLHAPHPHPPNPSGPWWRACDPTVILFSFLADCGTVFAARITDFDPLPLPPAWGLLPDAGFSWNNSATSSYWKEGRDQLILQGEYRDQFILQGEGIETSLYCNEVLQWYIMRQQISVISLWTFWVLGSNPARSKMLVSFRKTLPLLLIPIGKLGTCRGRARISPCS